MGYELQHHGIIGQRWGVRRYQNLDGSWTAKGRERYGKDVNKLANKVESRTFLTEERSIPAGTKMYRTSINPNENQNGPAYVTYLDPERNLYKGGWVRNTAGADKSYEYKFTLKKDLKIPSRETEVRVISDVINKDRNKTLGDIVMSRALVMYSTSSIKDLIKNYYDNDVVKFEKEQVARYNRMNPDMLAYYATQSFGLNTKLKDEVISRLSKMGYNAMPDEASIGGRYGQIKEGYDPLILFDRSFLQVDSVDEISKREEKKALDATLKWREKAKKKSVAWSVDFTNDILQHHGIKGQRWGVRRYQNYDGSLTAAGRRRVGQNYKEQLAVEKRIDKLNKKRDSNRKAINLIIENKKLKDLKEEEDLLLNQKIWDISKYAPTPTKSKLSKLGGWFLKEVISPPVKAGGQKIVGNAVSPLVKKLTGEYDATDKMMQMIKKQMRDYKLTDIDDKMFADINDLLINYFNKL
nr:MAG TPA: hypothetical protein [Caudoviricetes sp.]